MNDTIKKQNTVFILACVLSFMMGCYFFNFLQQETTELWNKTRTVQTGIISPFLTGTETTWATKLSTTTSNSKNKTDWGNKNLYQKPVKPLLVWWVSAGYDGDTVFERVLNRLMFIWVDSGTSDFITRKCFSTAVDPKHCVESVVWIATSESSLFKRCKNNNCMWLKPSWELKWYDTLNLALDDWINRYNKYRYKNNSGKDWIIRSHYCKWDCGELSDWWSNWTRAFDWAVNKLWI